MSICLFKRRESKIDAERSCSSPIENSHLKKSFTEDDQLSLIPQQLLTPHSHAADVYRCCRLSSSKLPVAVCDIFFVFVDVFLHPYSLAAAFSSWASFAWQAVRLFRAAVAAAALGMSLFFESSCGVIVFVASPPRRLRLY